MARVYAVASAKGGVGKTTTTANLGATLAGTGASVVVIDGDVGMANLGAALGVSPDGATLHDVLSGDEPPENASYEGPEGITVIPGDTSLSSFAAAEPRRLETVVEAYTDADYILIDVGAGISHETSVPLSLADAVLLVSTAERDALVDTDKTRQLTERLGGVVAGAVITRVDEATPVSEVVAGNLQAEVLTTIPEDEAVRESIAVGEPLYSYAPHSPAAAAYRQLAAALTGIDPQPPANPPAAEPASETMSALEASGEQLADSLADTAVADTQPTDTADSQPPQSASTASTEAPAKPETASTQSEDSNDKHNVVNPFAAKPESERPVASQPADKPESKWAEAATGTSGDVEEFVPDDVASETPESSPSSDNTPAERPAGTHQPTATEAEDDTVPDDAIPFHVADDETDPSPSTRGSDSGTTADEPLIPDAEETAASTDSGDDGADQPPEDESAADEDSEKPTKKKGFLRRLFG